MRNAIATGLMMFTASVAAAGGAQTWGFDETTTGNDVTWTSPTSVDAAAGRYLVSYELTLIEATVTFLGAPIVQDVTGQVPADLLTGSTLNLGPAPVTPPPLQIVYPEPPAPIGVAATVTTGLDAAGFGQLLITDVILGTVEVDLGIFGIQTVPITAIRVAGTLTIDPIAKGDANNDGIVNFDDVLAVLGGWGSCPIGPLCFSDLNIDGSTGFDDLLEVLSNWS